MFGGVFFLKKKVKHGEVTEGKHSRDCFKTGRVGFSYCLKTECKKTSHLVTMKPE